MQYRFILAQRPVLVKRWMHLPTAKPAQLLRYMAPRRECCSPRAAFPGHSLQHFMEKCDFSTSVRKIFQKPLAFFRQACYCCIQQEQVVEHNVPSLFLCSFFFYIIYCYFLHLPSYHLPCCPPVGTKKSDGLPARAIAFSFCIFIGNKTSQAALWRVQLASLCRERDIFLRPEGVCPSRGAKLWNHKFSNAVRTSPEK